MRPTLFVAGVAIAVLYGTWGLERLGARDDLDQFLRDHRLAHAVVGDGLLADHVARVAGGVVHRAHARALFGGGVFQQRAEDLGRDIAGQKFRENVFFLGLIFVNRATAAFLVVGKNRRNDLLRGRNLRNHGLVFGRDPSADIALALLESRA